MENKVKLVRKNLTQLKDEYETSYKTMIKMLLTVPYLEVKNRKVRDYSPKEVEMIYKHLGVPGAEYDEE